MPNDKITAVGANIAEKAAMIWNVADMLRGPFKPHEYGLVILPMTVVKRFHDCLLPTHQAVLDTYEKVKKLQVIDGFLQKASGYQFYNTSRFTFETLLADPDNIESNFRDYLSGFSANAQDVLAKFDFDNIIKRMVESNTLYLVIKEFGSEKGYLGPDKISAVDCGYIFEDLVRRFSESFGEEAGAHFTSRDIIYLMTDLLLSEADLDTSSMTVYDMAMGTSQMLSCMEERIHELNSDIEVTCFGQEFNPSTFAIAKADMMIRGGDPNNMRFGDTLSEDQFPGFTFQYIISNPPFGIDWKREQKAVEAEAARGEMGRFAPGLPKISDGQQLFVLNGLAKLANKGKMAIIQNGSPLFSGDAGSGPSNIRQYILENDWLDCIIQLSTDMFMNTGICLKQPASTGCSSRVWVLPTSILQSKIRVCGAQCSNESPSGAFKRQNGLQQQTEGPCPNKFADVYTSALLAGAMKPLNVLPKFENHFANQTVRFQVQLEAGGYFSAQKFSPLQPPQAEQAGTTSQFLNPIFSNPNSKTFVGLRPNPIFSTRMR